MKLTQETAAVFFFFLSTIWFEMDPMHIILHYKRQYLVLLVIINVTDVIVYQKISIYNFIHYSQSPFAYKLLLS